MLTVYHYPRCSTCKKALKWLEAHGVEAKLVHAHEQMTFWGKEVIRLQKLLHGA